MDYREKFDLQEQRMSQNECGDVSTEWETVYSGYARVASLGSTEYWQAAATNQQETLKLFCRWHKRLDMLDTVRHRIVWRGRHLDILSIDNLNGLNGQCVIRAAVADG